MVFGEQIMPILTERIERHFASRETADLEASGEVEILRDRLTDFVRRAVDSYQQDDTEAASSLLDKFENTLAQQPMAAPERSFASQLIEQMRDYFATSDKLSQQIGGPARNTSLGTGESGNLSPELVESTLSPLASAKRIDLLLRLADESDSLAGLSKKTGMQKGHLQFHLKVLLKAALVKYDKKGHLYSLTSQGAIAIDEASRLVDRLAPPQSGITQ